MPEPIIITFVTWVPETDSVAIKHNGEVVWEENSFDSLSEYLRCAPLGVPVVLKVETPDDDHEEEDGAASAEPADD